MHNHYLGLIGKPLPHDFRHNLTIKEFLASECEEDAGVRVMGTDDSPGQAWDVGPIHFERYYGDQEPELSPAPYARFVFWHPITRTNVPQYWHRDLLNGSLVRQIGFAYVDSSQYWKGWEYAARRLRNKWNNQREFIIVPSDYKTFEQGYPRHGKYNGIRSWVFGNVRRKVKQFGTRVHFFAARHVVTGDLGGMVVLVELARFHKVYYLAAFVTPLGARATVPTGLVDHCFKFCQTRGIPFLDFGAFWVPGNPADWKGFSFFKQKFGTTLVRYPIARWRFVRRGKI